ncbi:MAG: M14 family metallocarboxypeptidase [Defluviitaleaceae bacterium]|nr:M14 family metallocarboxypeptidase [Defluviitaleaceae bacterium]
MIKNKSFTSTHLTEAIERLTQLYPLIDVSVFGTSRLGRPLYALTIGHGAKAIMINAAHHANEWITSIVLMKFLEECAQNYKINCKLWDNITLHCIPMVNPDGVDLVTGGIEHARPAYKHARTLSAHYNQPFPNGWKANICGVDLNSNYPSNWELARKHKYERGYTTPSPRDFVGSKPLSEPETCAMVAYTQINDFALTISLHTQGEEIYWRYMDYMPEGAEKLAKRFEEVSGYFLEDVPSESSHAGYRDWFISTFNRPGFTIECGLGENPLPLSQLDDIYKKTSPILREALVWECVGFNV